MLMMRPPRPPRAHERRAFLRHDERGADIGGHDAIEVVEVAFEQWLPVDDAGVVDADVDAPELLAHLADARPDRRLVGQIQR